MIYAIGTKVEITNGLHKGERGIVTGYSMGCGQMFVEVLSDGCSEAWVIANTKAVK